MSFFLPSTPTDTAPHNLREFPGTQQRNRPLLNWECCLHGPKGWNFRFLNSVPALSRAGELKLAPDRKICELDALGGKQKLFLATEFIQKGRPSQTDISS